MHRWFRFANQRRFCSIPSGFSSCESGRGEDCVYPARARSFWRERENADANRGQNAVPEDPKTCVNTEKDFTLFEGFSQGLAALLFYSNALLFRYLHAHKTAVAIAGRGGALA
jgi:hypothetical protein